MKRRFLSMLLVGTMLFSMPITASAASTQAQTAADTLHSLGLFNGTGTDASGKPIYQLDRAATRAEATTMLVRLLGKEDEAKSGTWSTPFTDVPAWAQPYVGYAYTNKLTTGTSATTFGGSQAISATQYLTLVLRAMGYESGTDFEWNKAWELSDDLGMTGGNYDANTKSFLRGDIAQISLNALNAPLKDSTQSLADQLSVVAPSPTLSSQTYGYWCGLNRTNDAAFLEIYHFDGGKYGCTYSVSNKNDESLWIGYDEGTYTTSGNTLILKRTKEYVLMNNASSCNVSETAKTLNYTATCTALDELTINNWSYGRQTDAKAAYDNIKAKIISKDNRPKSADYAYLAGNDFRSIRRQYNSAVATYGYVYAYQNNNKENCVLTLVGYKILSQYSQFTLHNLSTGQTITDPSNYYQKLADHAWGAEALNYMDLSIETLEHQQNMLVAVNSILKGGSNTSNGVFVAAETLNK